jgi:Asp-tRNA(Asn)/Glu-tRNA(Gln) amidotransferase A subunit family amidase
MSSDKPTSTSLVTVAVASRLYFTRTADKPYTGLRFVIKEIIDLKGLKTGASSLAYTALHPPRTNSMFIHSFLFSWLSN